MIPSAQTGTVARLLADADAILLDFNGTLSDDEDLVAELVADIASRELGVELTRERYFAEFVGETEDRMFRALMAESDRSDGDDHAATIGVGEIVARFNRAYLERVRADRRISPEAEAFVLEARSRGKSIAVVTAASTDIVVPALNQVELLESIDVVVALEDVEHSKPAPDCYLRALELLESEPENAVVFEDSRTGLTAASAAGIETIAVGGISAEDRAVFTPHAVDRLHPGLFG